MTKFLKLFLIISFFFLKITSVNSSENIAFINLDILLSKSNYGKTLMDEIQKLNNKNIEKLKKNESELKKKEVELNKKKNIISTDEFQKELNLLKKQVKSLRNQKDKMVKDIEQKRINDLNVFFSKVNPIIQNYMNNNSIDILLDQKNVFIGKNSSDITDVIILEINKNIKK